MLALNANMHGISFIDYLFCLSYNICIAETFKKMDGNVRYIFKIVTKH